MKNLTTLELSKVTDRTLRTLRELGLLHALASATAVGRGRPTKPEDVVEINLSSTEVTDTGLKELAAFPNLTRLYMWDTNVTDVGVKALVSLKNLTALELGRTKVTERGVEELQYALPKCKIER